ncbi:MAG: hypothetical protein KBC78_02475 [Candidatus Pacebacteria bacterium]|nr:hypothetical protein [Candidatus Paceibacterota bacterium]
MKTIRFVLIAILCNLFFSNLAFASLKEVRLFPGLANEQNWNAFVAESTKVGKVNAQGILTDFLAEGAIQYTLNGKDELSGDLRKAVKPEMLQEIKDGKYENYFQFFREFNSFGERIPLVTLKQLVAIKEGEKGIFAPMHQSLDGDQAVEVTKKVDVVTEVSTVNKVAKPVQKPEMDSADKFAQHLVVLNQRVQQLSSNQGSSKEVQALKAQFNALKSQLTQLTNSQNGSTVTLQELQAGMQNLNAQLNEFSGDVSGLSSLVTDFSAGFQVKFAELEGKIPSSNLWQVIAVAVIAVMALLLSIVGYRKISETRKAQAQTNKQILEVKAVADKAAADVSGVSSTVRRLDGEVLGLGIANTTSLASVSNFFINDEKSLTSKTLAELALGKRKNVTVQVDDSVLEVTFEKKSETDVLVHGIKRHELATEAMILVSVSTNPAKVIRNAVARNCLVGTAVVNLSLSNVA